MGTKLIIQPTEPLNYFTKWGQWFTGCLSPCWTFLCVRELESLSTLQRVT